MGNTAKARGGTRRLGAAVGVTTLTLVLAAGLTGCVALGDSTREAADRAEPGRAGTVTTVTPETGGGIVASDGEALEVGVDALQEFANTEIAISGQADADASEFANVATGDALEAALAGHQRAVESGSRLQGAYLVEGEELISRSEEAGTATITFLACIDSGAAFVLRPDGLAEPVGSGDYRIMAEVSVITDGSLSLVERTAEAPGRDC